MSSGISRFFKIASDRFFWGQHPEAALRYIPVVKEIKKRNLENFKILEIGSGSLGIVPYLQMKIDGIDVDFSGPQTKYLRKIKGSANKLPFKKNYYDVSFSVDVLEHLHQKNREQAIYEQLRVARKLSVIVVPCGKNSELQDKMLRERWNRLFRKNNQFLDEHVKYGLPEKPEIFQFINNSLTRLKKKAKISAYPNLNISIRSILMKTWIDRSKLLYYLYLKGFLILIPILKYCNFGKAYRQVFVIEFAS